MLEHELRLERARPRLGLARRRAGTAPASPTASSFQAERSGCDSAAVEQRRDRLDQLLDDEPAVADDRHVGPADLAQLGGVDVDVDDLGLGGEAGDLAGDPVVEPRARAR